MTFSWDLALKVNINYQVTDYSFNCNMILLIPGAAILNIKCVLDRILAEF
jgi:chemotaxis protein CheC